MLPVPARRCSGRAAATAEVLKAPSSTATVVRTASDREALGQEGPAQGRSSTRRGGRWGRGREEVAVAVAGAVSPVRGRTDGLAGCHSWSSGILHQTSSFDETNY
jgi:hypothetical protein